MQADDLGSVTDELGAGGQRPTETVDRVRDVRQRERARAVPSVHGEDRVQPRTAVLGAGSAGTVAVDVDEGRREVPARAVDDLDTRRGGHILPAVPAPSCDDRLAGYGDPRVRGFLRMVRGIPVEDGGIVDDRLGAGEVGCAHGARWLCGLRHRCSPIGSGRFQRIASGLTPVSGPGSHRFRAHARPGRPARCGTRPRRCRGRGSSAPRPGSRGTGAACRRPRRAASSPG